MKCIVSIGVLEWKLERGVGALALSIHCHEELRGIREALARRVRQSKTKYMNPAVLCAEFLRIVFPITW